MAQPRSPRAHARTARSHPARWILITALLVAAVVGTLWIPFYNRATPALGGFPFFYWYQLLWVPIVAILSALAYLLTKRAATGNGAGASLPPEGPPESRTAGRGEVS